MRAYASPIQTRMTPWLRALDRKTANRPIKGPRGSTFRLQVAGKDRHRLRKRVFDCLVHERG